MLLPRIPVVCFLLFCALGCSRTHQPRRVQTDSFLGDYLQLREEGKGADLLTHRNPEADLSQYGRVLVEPITVWRPVDSVLSEVPDEDLERLAAYLYVAIVEGLREDYEIVDRPGPGVLRIRGAITEAANSWLVLDTVKTASPQLRLLSTHHRLGSGTLAFVERASVEGEVRDSLTEERLFAVVDRTVGSKMIQAPTRSWDDVQKAYDDWVVRRLRDRLREEEQRDRPGF